MQTIKPEITVKRPDDCSSDETSAFSAFVLAGGQVQEQGLDELIRGAHSLGFARVDGTLASIAAIKCPRDSYRDGIFHKAHSPENPSAFRLEFGWAHTLKPYAGQKLNSGIADSLLPNIHQPIFATTDSANAAMKHMLTKRGFTLSGNQYLGNNKKDMKVLFVRK